MHILVSNDDGIDAPGIYALFLAMQELGEVSVVAPDRQQSAVGHSLTISNPLRVTPFDRDGRFFGYSVSGTPSDCVKLAISELLPSRPDIVVSGINHGQNTAINILYSGTVSAATEGMLSGIPAVAISIASHDYSADFSEAIKYSRKVVQNLDRMNLPADTFLNVNIPYGKDAGIKGIKVVRHNDTIWKDSYDKRRDPFGREYYWFSGIYEHHHLDAETDDVALSQGYVTISPIHYNITNRQVFDSIRFIEGIL